MAGNTGSYSDVSTHNVLRKHNTQKQKWWLFYLALPLWAWPQTNCIWGKQGETAANLIINLEAVVKKDSAPGDKRWRKTSERLERRRAGHCWLWRGVWVSQSSAQAEIKLWATCWSRLGEKHNYHSVHVLLPQLSGNQHLMLNKWTKCATKFSLFFSFFFFLSPWILILFIKSQVLGWK